MKIDHYKQYRTKSGKEVRIYEISENGPFPVHGAIKGTHWWEIESWTREGRVDHYMEREDDLVEVKPRIKRTVWMNVYEDGAFSFLQKENADLCTKLNRLACVPVEIDCEEGEGLT